jgi:hypothetical protein
MKTYGVSGRGGSNHAPDPGLLRGLLATDDTRVYPDDRCPECEAEGVENEHCFHEHWLNRATTPGGTGYSNPMTTSNHRNEAQ